MNYVFEWIDDNPHVAFFGNVDYALINEATERIYGDQRLDNMKYLICNLENVESLSLDPVEMKIISVLDRYIYPYNQHLKIAGVVKDQKIREMILKYMEDMKDLNWKIKIFSSFNDALAWCQE